MRRYDERDRLNQRREDLRFRIAVISSVCATVVLSFAQEGAAQTTIERTISVGRGDSVIIARRGPRATGRMAQRQQIMLSGEFDLDSPSTSMSTIDEGAPAHRVPWVGGTAQIALGIAQDFELSVGCSFAPTSLSVPIARDAILADRFRSFVGECATDLRYRRVIDSRVAAFFGGELGVLTAPSHRVFQLHTITNTISLSGRSVSVTDTSTTVSSLGVGALSNGYGGVMFTPHRWVELELGASVGVFTTIAGRSIGTRDCLQPDSCSGPTLEQQLGLDPGITATAWTAVTIGNAPLQLVLRGTLTTSPLGSSTGSLVGALIALRVAFSYAPRAVSTASAGSTTNSAGPSAPTRSGR